MDERLKKLRNALGISQENFGVKIGVTRSAVCNYESGSRPLTERVIKDICREFNVSYMWIKDGLGDIFEDEDTETTALFDRIMAGENETAKAVFKAFAKLNDDDWKVIGKIINEIKK